MTPMMVTLSYFTVLGIRFSGWWDGVVNRTAIQGLASAEAPCGQGDAMHDAVGQQGLSGVLGAVWLKAAARPFEPGQIALVECDDADQQVTEKQVG